MTPLHTERLTLRSFEPSDAPDVLAAMTDKDVARWIPLLPHPYGQAEAEAFVTLQNGPDGNALAVMHDGRLVGCMTTGMELGYWFSKRAWGYGFATEAARAVVARFFGQGHEEMPSGHMPDNPRSHRVLEKLGFADTETVVRYSDLLAAEVTVQRMVLTRETWEAGA